jgi:hypothetical protein
MLYRPSQIITQIQKHVYDIILICFGALLPALKTWHVALYAYDGSMVHVCRIVTAVYHIWNYSILGLGQDRSPSSGKGVRETLSGQDKQSYQPSGLEKLLLSALTDYPFVLATGPILYLICFNVYFKYVITKSFE